MPATPQGERSGSQGVVGAGAVVFDGEGRVLLVCRGHAPSKGEWSLPGGRVEAEESPEAAAVRELREETGIDGRVVSFLALVTVQREDATYRIHEYLLAATSVRQPCAGDDASDVRWASLDALAALGVRADAVAVIEDAWVRWGRAREP